MPSLNLAGEWLATWGDGLHGRFEHANIPLADPQRYVSMQFPGSIQTNAQALGLVDDPRLSINSLKARWIEEHFWILRKTFAMPPGTAGESPRLHIGILDGVAKVILNGQAIGEHWNSHRPVEMDLSGALKAGENELVILLESGLFKVADLPGMDYSQGEDTRLNKRHHLRQPQYQFGWDWNPRLVFFGLHGVMEVVWGSAPRLLQTPVTVDVSPDLSHGQIRLRPRWFVPGIAPVDVRLHLTSRDGLSLEQDVQLPPGESATELLLDVPQPELWWPRGHGTQALYPLELTARVNGEVVEHWTGSTGLRRVEIAEPPHPQEGRYFQLKVNNRVIMCKGSNWVPPEMSGYEVSDERVEQLVDLAVEQNFNLLRLWGGGVWAGHTLLNLCDQRGLLVWHDLLFACSKYPADRPEFLEEVERELAWGLREFSPHPSLAVWCGNNEMEWGLWDWKYKQFGRTAPDFVLFHHIIPILHRQIDPTRPYWPSSPYSGPDEEPNDPTRGDQHPWNVSLLHPTQAWDLWMYRQFVDRFPNEGGVLGISPLVSLREFLKDNELAARSFAWEHHDNTISFWHAQPGIGYEMVWRWLDRPVTELPLAELVAASQLIQAEGLKEYIRNYRRRWPSTTSAIYWDYVDSWPSIHGWGTLDYYLRRKPSFHVVRRGFAPLVVVLADEGDRIGVYVANDAPEARRVQVEVGSFAPAGARQALSAVSYTALPFSSLRVAELPRQPERVAYALIYDEQGQVADWDRLLLTLPRRLPLAKPEIEVSVIETPAGRMARYLSPTWVWLVVLDPDGSGVASDDCFDLLPGIPYDIALGAGQSPLPVRLTGNGLLTE